MKKLTCEMCGSTDLLKQDGVFVCQSCGTKYSVEEAKKMMVEGTVDVSGSTVKVDSSDELENLYQIARRAKDEGNSGNAARYYDMILVKDPTSWEAAFYVVYFKAMECKIAQIRSAAVSVSNCESNVFSLIRDHVPEEEQTAAVDEVVDKCMYIATVLAAGAKNHYDGIDAEIRSNYTKEYIDNVFAAMNILYNCGTQIERTFLFESDIASYAADAWKAGITIHKSVLPYLADVQGNKKLISMYVDMIGRYDEEYKANYINAENKTKRKAQLEREIASLKETIKKEDLYTGKATWTADFLLFGGILFVVLAILCFCKSSDLVGTGIIGLLFGIPSLYIGIKLIIFNKKNKENDLKAASAAKIELPKKEKELSDLMKQ